MHTETIKLSWQFTIIVLYIAILVNNSIYQATYELYKDYKHKWIIFLLASGFSTIIFILTLIAIVKQINL